MAILSLLGCATTSFSTGEHAASSDPNVYVVVADRRDPAGLVRNVENQMVRAGLTVLKLKDPEQARTTMGRAYESGNQVFIVIVDYSVQSFKAAIDDDSLQVMSYPGQALIASFYYNAVGGWIGWYIPTRHQGTRIAQSFVDELTTSSSANSLR